MHMEVDFVVSFGLEVFASIFVFTAMALEVFMKNSIASFKSAACVWCGIAFLRRSGEKKFSPSERLESMYMCGPAKSERRGFDSLSPHQIHNGANKAFQTDKVVVSHLLQMAQKMRHNNFAAEQRRYCALSVTI